MGNAAGGAHFQTPALYQLNLHTSCTSLVLDRDHEAERYNGLYYCSTPAWTAHCGTLHLSTRYRCDLTICAISAKHKRVTCVSGDSNESWTLLDANEHVLVAMQSRQNRPSRLFVASTADSVWHELDVPFLAPAALTSELAALKHATVRVSDNVDAILLQPPGEHLPLVLFPHGGPHSAYATMYSLDPLMFALSGFAVARVNYTGSIGYGAASIQALVGRVGELDVGDCVDALDTVLKDSGLDRTRVFYYGGSHGGYLGAMLSAKYPVRDQGGLVLESVPRGMSHQSRHRLSLYAGRLGRSRLSIRPAWAGRCLFCRCSVVLLRPAAPTAANPRRARKAPQHVAIHAR